MLAATSWIATEGISDAEEGAFALVNELPDWLEPTLWLPMQLGSLFGPAAVALAAWVAWREWRPALGAIVVGVGSWQLAKIVKAAFERGRPHTELDELVRRAGTPTEGLGFVSGHAAVAFGLATVVAPYLGRRWWWAGYLAAGVVAAARIHVGAHFPLDVVGGAALGCALGFVWRLAVGTPTTDAGDGAPPQATSTP